MASIVATGGIVLILVVLWDAFETIALPRRVTRRLRLTRIFYRLTWVPWSALARRLPNSNHRETYLSFYGPLSLILLLVVWAVALVIGFGLVQWGLGSRLIGPDAQIGLGTDLY
ncbi:MAG: two pore domain potassium channel family protein, partial [Dehalococcoidia bacterium]